MLQNNIRCSITRGRALELQVVQKSVYLVPSMVKQRMLQTVTKKLPFVFPSSAAQRKEKSKRRVYLATKINQLYAAEIAKRTDTKSVQIVIDGDALDYAEVRETCLLDELRFAWFQYLRYVESLGIRAATSEIAIGSISAELPAAEWNNAINQFEKSIHDGILMLNSDDSDLKFVTRNFSSAIDLTSIFKENFLLIAGLPEEILFGKTTATSGLAEKLTAQVFGINMAIETLAIYWAELMPDLYEYYDFVSVETWMGAEVSE